MHKLFASATVVALLGIAVPVLASPLDGVWLTPDANGTVRLYECGAALCGKIVDSDNIRANPGLTDVKNKDASLRSRTMKDLQIISGVTGGPKVWKNGSVYNPEDGGTYHGALTLIDPDTVKLEGCIIYPFCKSEVWHRVR